MATFRLVLPKAPWLSCLEELRLCYGWALRDAGHAVTYAATYLDTGEYGEDFQLAFGAHAVPPPDPFWRVAIMQSEHHAHHFKLDYLRVLERAHLVVNMGPFDLRLQEGYKLAGKGLVECPPGILSLDRVVEHSPLWVPGGGRSIDVLHYGSVTPRRARIFEALSKAGIQVTALYGVLGEKRDWYIDRAKVVLDLKQEGDEPDDQTRAWWALSRGACVLSENAPCAPEESLIRISPETAVTRVTQALTQGPALRDIVRDAYIDEIGQCNVSPLLKALGLYDGP